MITVLAVHFTVAVVAPFLFRVWGRNAFYALAAVPAASFIWLLFQHGPVYSGDGAVTEVVPWIQARRTGALPRERWRCSYDASYPPMANSRPGSAQRHRENCPEDTAVGEEWVPGS